MVGGVPFRMYLLRRAAVRAISQPSRHLSTFRPTTTRVTFRQPSKPVIYRSLHQTRIWLADEQRTQREEASPADVETTGETVPPQGTKENIEAGEIADAATKEASQAARDANQDAILESSAATGELPAKESQAVTEEMQDQFVDDAATAGRAAETASAAAASTQASSSQPPRQGQSAMFPNAGSSTPAGPRGESRPNRILYIGNLFFEVTAAQLEQEFQRFGEVTNSRVVTDSRGLSKGFAYIEFARQESADQAIRELDQRVFQGRRMAVQYHVRREPKRFSGAIDKAPNAPSKTLFIGNMSYQMSDRDLNDLFREIRDVLDVRVAIDRRSGQPRGFAHADFIDVNAAERAKEVLEKKSVYGRQLRVDFSQSSNATQPS